MIFTHKWKTIFFGGGVGNDCPSHLNTFLKVLFVLHSFVRSIEFEEQTQNQHILLQLLRIHL